MWHCLRCSTELPTRPTACPSCGHEISRMPPSAPVAPPKEAATVQAPVAAPPAHVREITQDDRTVVVYQRQGPLGKDVAGQIDALLAQNRVIEAIKIYRQQTGVGLKEAKDAIDELRARR